MQSTAVHPHCLPRLAAQAWLHAAAASWRTQPCGRPTILPCSRPHCSTCNTEQPRRRGRGFNRGTWAQHNLLASIRASVRQDANQKPRPSSTATHAPAAQRHMGLRTRTRQERSGAPHSSTAAHLTDLHPLHSLGFTPSAAVSTLRTPPPAAASAAAGWNDPLPAGSQPDPATARQKPAIESRDWSGSKDPCACSHHSSHK